MRRLPAALAVAGILGCSGGTDVDNALVQGQVRDHGMVVASARVTLMPEDYNPVLGDPTGRTRTMLSDSNGGFGFPDMAPGRYSLEVVHPTLRRMDWMHAVTVATGTTMTLAAALDTARRVIVRLPDSTPPETYIFIPGTEAYALRDSADTGAAFTLSHVSADSIPLLGIGTMADPGNPKIMLLALPPGRADTAVVLPLP